MSDRASGDHKVNWTEREDVKGVLFVLPALLLLIAVLGFPAVGAVLQSFNPTIEKDVYDVLSLRGSLNARNILGGTAPAQVRQQIARHQARLA